MKNKRALYLLHTIDNASSQTYQFTKTEKVISKDKVVGVQATKAHVGGEV